MDLSTLPPLDRPLERLAAYRKARALEEKRGQERESERPPPLRRSYQLQISSQLDPTLSS